MQSYKISKNLKNDYSLFDSLDGTHPLKEVIPNGFVDYPARLRKGGKVRYFNFNLAKEMGLIPSDHPNQLNSTLEAKILETFSIQIINEYDQLKNKKFPKSEMKDGKYMATRYLQLQHEDKKGRTSGDGRSIWNGQIQYNGQTWDISSGGTGGTCLSPATSKYNKFFETGDPSISYGCGYAEIDEGLATAIMSKALKRNGYSTEESLAIIEFKDNISINVRAHSCLIRPSHFFLYLKQNRLEELKNLLEYYIESNRYKSEWKTCPKGVGKYKFALNKFAQDFAKATANFEDDYIFCWLDWDGDNILMDAGILDYGSVRQFGICHYEYRYDDVEQFSTNLLEQKKKARQMVQTFAQLINYVKEGTKDKISAFKDCEATKHFDKVFENQKNINLLKKIGFTERKTKHLLKKYPHIIKSFKKNYTYFERVKSSSGIIKVSDGVNCDVIFNMREALKNLSQVYLVNNLKKIDSSEFIDLIKSGFITEKETEISAAREKKINSFQNTYIKLLKRCAKLFQITEQELLQEVAFRSSVINKGERITGDAVTHIIDYILKNRKTFDSSQLFEFLENLEKTQNLNPDLTVSRAEFQKNSHFNHALNLIIENREGI